MLGRRNLTVDYTGLGELTAAGTARSGDRCNPSGI